MPGLTALAMLARARMRVHQSWSIRPCWQRTADTVVPQIAIVTALSQVSSLAAGAFAAVHQVASLYVAAMHPRRALPLAHCCGGWYWQPVPSTSCCRSQANNGALSSIEADAFDGLQVATILLDGAGTGSLVLQLGAFSGVAVTTEILVAQHTQLTVDTGAFAGASIAKLVITTNVGVTLARGKSIVEVSCSLLLRYSHHTC